MTRRHTSRFALVAAAAATAAAILVARRTEAGWLATADPAEPADRLLPVGASLRIPTDDGALLAATVAGPVSGPTVVLAHGWTSAREIWAPVAHRLIRRGHRVVLYDQRGHGSSTVGAEGFTIPRLGADLAAVLEAVDVRDAVLAGHSMGGMTVQSLAVHHPDVLAARADALVLVATAAHGLGNPRLDARAQRVIGSRALERAMGTRAGLGLFRGTVGAAAAHGHLLTARDLFLATPPATRRGWLAAMQTMDLRPGLAGITLPTAVVVGAKDQLTPVRLSEALADAIPGAVLTRLEGHGHMLPLEAPDALAELLSAAALTEVTPPAPQPVAG